MHFQMMSELSESLLLLSLLPFFNSTTIDFVGHLISGVYRFIRFSSEFAFIRAYNDISPPKSTQFQCIESQLNEPISDGGIHTQNIMTLFQPIYIFQNTLHLCAKNKNENTS